MNSNVDHTDPTVHYYDCDYPSKNFSVYPENFDETTRFQGIQFDVDCYLEIARKTQGHILEICSGTGRVTIPLAHAGHQVTCVDISEGMSQKLHQNIVRVDASLLSQIESVVADATKFDLKRKDHGMAILAFNSLLCVPSLERQMQTLNQIHNHLKEDGLLVIDIVNPLGLNISGDSLPKAFFTRRNDHTGNLYTRFAMLGPMDADHKQRLHGWYDEVLPTGQVQSVRYHNCRSDPTFMVPKKNFVSFFSLVS